MKKAVFPYGSKYAARALRKKAECGEHVLKFVRHGLGAKCSCGKWEVTFSGETLGEMQKLWDEHKKTGR